MGALMHSAIFIRSLRARWKSTLVWSLGLFALALLFAGLHQSFASEINDLVGLYPEDLQAFVGNISGAAEPAGWLGLQLYNIFLPFVVGAIGVGFGSSAIGKEEESGTLELLLASPISRGRILLQKAAAIEAQLAIIAGSLWLGVAIGSVIFPFDVSLLDVFWASFMGWLMGVFFGFGTLALQTLSGNRGFALSTGIAVLVIGYFADALAQLFDWLLFLQYFSPFYYYDGPGVLLNGLDAVSVAVLVGSSLLFYVIAHLAFTTRDTGL